MMLKFNCVIKNIKHITDKYTLLCTGPDDMDGYGPDEYQPCSQEEEEETEEADYFCMSAVSILSLWCDSVELDVSKYCIGRYCSLLEHVVEYYSIIPFTAIYKDYHPDNTNCQRCATLHLSL